MVDEKLNIITLDAKLLLEKLIKILPFPAYIKNSTGEYLMCNDFFANKIMGIAAEELTGKKASEFTHLVSKKEVNYYETLDRELILFGGIKQFETELICADGVKHFFHEIKTAFQIDSDNSGIIGIMIDLTETKRIKKAYADQKQYLKIFMDFIPDAVFFKDKEGKYLKANKTEAKNLGASNPKKVVGKKAEEFFPEHIASEIEAEEKNILETGEILNVEKEILYPDGSLHWVHTTKVPFPDEKGEIAGLFGISRDITENKRNERDLKYKLEFEKILSMISNNLMKIGYAKFQDGLKYAGKKINRFFNSKSIHFFFFNNHKLNYEFSVKKDKTVFSLNTKERKRFLLELKGSSKTLKYIIVNDYYLIGTDKSDDKFNLYLPLIKEDNSLGAVVVEDINIDIELIERNASLLNILTELFANGYELYSMEMERNKIEAEMHKMISAVEQSANIVMILDIKGRIEYVNKRFKVLTGFEQYEVISKNPVSFVISVDAQTDLRTLWRTIKNGEQWTGTFLVNSKKGNKIWLNAVVSPIYEEGRITNFLAILEDVTERIKNQNRIAVSQKLEAIGQLAAGIAHEINTPMQFIGDNNTFLKDSFRSVLSFFEEMESSLEKCEEAKKKVAELKNKYEYDYFAEEIPAAIEQSAEGIERITKIVKAMKEFAHPSEKEKAFNDINKAIKNTVVISRNAWKYCSDLKLNLQPDIPQVFCQIDSINQVILNMIINAAHAIEKKMKNSGKKGVIKVETKLINNNLEISISDTGCGIPKENMSRIFDPFFTTKEVGKGTGQGLAIAHDIIVTKHNGAINVKSEVGEGTTFNITLPINYGDEK